MTELLQRSINESMLGNVRRAKQRYCFQLSMKILVVVCACVSLVITGCNNADSKLKPVTIKIRVRNLTDHQLHWVKIYYHPKGMESVGVMNPGIEKTFSFMPWHFPDSGTISISEPNEVDKYSTDISFEDANKQLRSGKCHELIIQVLGVDKAEVSCK